MSCIVCGSGNGGRYYCSIKEMCACFCDQHYKENKNYDWVLIKQDPVAIQVSC